MNVPIWMLTLTVLLLSGCASEPQQDPKSGIFKDPYQEMNRSIFKFNMTVDKAIFRPIAKFYDKNLPREAQKRISNVTSNVDTINHIINDLLQADISQAIADTARFTINTTIGILGIFDVASYANLNDHHQDFGLTLAKWGVEESPFFMVPIFGPKTLRDAGGFVLDSFYLSGWDIIDPTSLRYTLLGLKFVNVRASLLPTDKLVDQAFDPYVFVRNAYLQNRSKEIQYIVKKFHYHHHNPEKNSDAWGYWFNDHTQDIEDEDEDEYDFEDILDAEDETSPLPTHRRNDSPSVSGVTNNRDFSVAEKITPAHPVLQDEDEDEDEVEE